MRASLYATILGGLTAALLTALFATAPQEAQAQGTGRGGAGGSAGGGTLTSADFLLRLLRSDGDGGFTIFTDFDRRTYFNRARCECSEKVRLEVDFSTTGAAKRNQYATSDAKIEVLIGSVDCVAKDLQVRSAATAAGQCEMLSEFTLGTLARTLKRTTIDFPISELYGPTGRECQRQGTQNVRLRIDFNNDGIPDLTETDAPSLSVEFDGAYPAQPTDVRVSPGTEALEVSWERPQTVNDLRGFVVLCSRAENLQVYEPDFYDDQYRTRETVCGATATAPTTQTLVNGAAAGAVGLAAASVDGGVPDAELFAAPPHFVSLDTRYVCSDLLVTQTSTRLRGLQNGIPYLVGVATIDTHGNASPIEAVLMQRPIPTRDFYSGYRAAGGEAEGGYCAVGGHAGGLGVGGLALLALGTLVTRRVARRRR